MKCQTCGRSSKVSETRTVYGGAVVRRMNICPEGHSVSSYEVTSAMWNSARSVFIKVSKGLEYNLKIEALREQKQRMLVDRLAGMNCTQLAEKYCVSLHMARYYSRLPRAKLYPAVKKLNGPERKN